MALMTACLSTTAFLRAQEAPGQNVDLEVDIENSDPFRKNPAEQGAELPKRTAALIEARERLLLAQRALKEAEAAEAQSREDAARATPADQQDVASSLNSAAWDVVAPGTDKASEAELDKAQKKAEMANKLTGYKDAAYLDTLARVHFTRGNVAKAFELQSKAATIANAEDHFQKVEISRTFAEYKARAEIQAGTDKSARNPASVATPNPASYEWAQAVRDLGNNPLILNSIAWEMVNPDREFGPRDLYFALSAAQRANQLTNGKDPDTLDTLARAHFTLGQIDKAIELQMKVVEIAPEDRKESFAKTLSEYKEKKAELPVEADPSAETEEDPFAEKFGN